MAAEAWGRGTFSHTFNLYILMGKCRSVCVASSLVALPTCGCQCHKWPCQRGKVILLGSSGLVRTVTPPGFAPVKVNMFSELSCTVYVENLVHVQIDICKM